MDQKKLQRINLELLDIKKEIADKEYELTALHIRRRTLQEILQEDMIVDTRTISDNELELYYQINNLLTAKKWINQKVVKKEMYKVFHERSPEFMLDIRAFARSLKAFCQYAGYELNPPLLANKDGRIKSDGVEYYYIKVPSQ